MKSYIIAYRKGLIKDFHDTTNTHNNPNTNTHTHNRHYDIGTALQEIENVQGCIEVANKDILTTLSNVYTLIGFE